MNEPGLARRRRPQAQPAGTFENVFARDVFNIRDYGAKPNDVSVASLNDTAIANAVNDMLATENGGTIYFPEGTWYISSAISVSTFTKSVRIIGDGCRCTKISQVTPNTGVIDVVHGYSLVPAERSITSIKNFTLENVWIHHNDDSSYLSSASAVKYTNIANKNNWPFSNGGPNFICRNVVVDPNDVGVNQRSFYRFFHIVGASNCNLDTITCFGGSNFNYGTGIYVEADDCKQVVVEVLDAFFSFMDQAIEVLGGTAGNLEGLYVTNGSFNGINAGIYTHSAYSADPQIVQMTVTNTYIDIAAGSGGRNTCIEGVVAQALFTGNNFYVRDDTTVIKGTFRGGSISGNTFTHGSPFTFSGTKAVVLEDNSNNITIYGNTFTDVITSTICEFGSGTSYNAFYGNIWSNTPTNVLVDNGTNNQLWRLPLFSTGINGTLTRINAQSIPNNTETAITWETQRFASSYGIWNSGTPTRINVPTNAKRMRLTAGIFWDTNSSTELAVKIKDQSGNVWARDGRVSGSSGDLGLNPGSCTLTTPIIDKAVSSVSYFEVFVWQLSGGALDVRASHGTYLSLEIF